jgi:hypothetical protein
VQGVHSHPQEPKPCVRSGARSAQIRDSTKHRRVRKGERQEGERNFSSRNPSESELSKSLKRKECMGNQSLQRPSSGGITLFISVKEIQESDSSKEQRFETFEHPEDLLTLKIA